MGIEFTAKFDKAVPNKILDDVTKDISANQDYQLVKLDGHNLKLLFSTPEEHSTGVEDIVLEIAPSSVYLLFHVGSQNEVNQFVKLVESTFASYQVICELHEE